MRKGQALVLLRGHSLIFFGRHFFRPVFFLKKILVATRDCAEWPHTRNSSGVTPHTCHRLKQKRRQIDSARTRLSVHTGNHTKNGLFPTGRCCADRLRLCVPLFITSRSIMSGRSVGKSCPQAHPPITPEERIARSQSVAVEHGKEHSHVLGDCHDAKLRKTHVKVLIM